MKTNFYGVLATFAFIALFGISLTQPDTEPSRFDQNIESFKQSWESFKSIPFFDQFKPRN